jgi:hypothetical protein
MDGLRPDFLPDRSLTADERAIEGLPIRLVIALVVGIAALAIMMGLLNGLPSLQDNEVDVDYVGEPVVEDDGDITMTVIDDDGSPVSDATVFLESDSAELDGTYYETTGSDGNVTFDFGSGPDQVTVDWRSNQNSGELAVDIDPPSDGDYSDSSGNSGLTVIKT